MPETRQTVTSLYRLTRLPVDYRDEIFALYPSFKLGVRQSTVDYARRLLPLAEALMASNAQPADWALTAPPYHEIPAAANLLCLEMFDRLKARLPTQLNLSLVKIAEQTHSFDGDKAPDDYSRLTCRERSDSRERSAGALLHHEGLSGRSVIFVNDINVTGAQQRVMCRYFERAGTTAIHWLYIIDVEKSLGKRTPQIEYAINNSKLATFDDFAHMMATEDMDFTSKCIARVFSYGSVELHRLFGMLSAERRSNILKLVLQDGRYRGDYFKEKIDLLTAFCSLDRGIAEPR